MSQQPEIKFSEVQDPGIRAFLIEGEKLYPENAVSFTMAEQRAFYDRYAAHFRKPRPASVAVEDFSIGAIPGRRYRRGGQAAEALLLYLHGGGHVLGGLDSHDDICAELCDATAVDVVAVQYRLAPENPFPAAFDDCSQVLTKLTPSYRRAVVGGDSAGGNLSAALCLKARDEGGPVIAGQVLIYPGLGGDISRGSYVTQASAPGHSTADVLYYRDIYEGGGNKFAAPLRETNFKGLPPAFLVAAGLDPVRDDCFDYAAHLKAAGVPAYVRGEPLLVHAFLRARHMSEPARASFAAIIDAVRSLAYEGTLPLPESR